MQHYLVVRGGDVAIESRMMEPCRSSTRPLLIQIYESLLIHESLLFKVQDSNMQQKQKQKQQKNSGKLENNTQNI